MALSIPMPNWPKTWVDWRSRLLVFFALLGCIALLILLRATFTVPHVHADFSRSPTSQVLLRTGNDRATAPMVVTGIEWKGQVHDIDVLLTPTTDRWTHDVELRKKHQDQQALLNAALTQKQTRWRIDEGQTVELPVAPRGALGQPWSFWPLVVLSLLLFLVAVVVTLARPIERNLVYATMAIAQAINVALLAMSDPSAISGSVLPHQLVFQLRCSMDVVTAAALVHASAIHPYRHGAAKARAMIAWTMSLAICIGLAVDPLAATGWWWVQAATLGGGVWATVQWRIAARQVMHPLGTLLYRFALCGSAIYLVTTGLAAVSNGLDHPARQAAEVGSTIWLVFFGLMLVLLPTMARTYHLMREFALIAAVSALATAMDLLFVATLSIGNFTSLALALFIALALYAGLRQWLLGRVMAHERFTAERTFEAVFNVARDVQSWPVSLRPKFAALMKELFDPLQIKEMDRPLKESVIADDGSAMWVPLPVLDGKVIGDAPTLKLTYAARGRRLFVAEDARLADRVREQLMRAVAYDQAVEHGRTEERSRIAQDLHDDIGARLLTLMYKASDAETEDYVRHTLKDLKTLTRGLAAANHKLSHACAEWKADASQRLLTADCDLAWSFVWDDDLNLSVVQWSALTRVLRELVSNVITHARASLVEIEGALERGTLHLRVADNGSGHSPDQWAHGLGLGGVRKRVSQMGGQARWRVRQGGGIVCEVIVPHFAAGQTSRSSAGSITSPGWRPSGFDPTQQTTDGAS
jgi:signal transduction histidine kinase